MKTLLNSNDLSELNPTPPDSTCHFAVYAQVQPSNVSAVDMRELEDELMDPTGVSTVKRPPLQLNLAAISPECGILVEVRKADGIRSRIFFRKVTSCASITSNFPFYMLIAYRWRIRRARLSWFALAAFTSNVGEQNPGLSIKNIALVIHRTSLGRRDGICWRRHAYLWRY